MRATSFFIVFAVAVCNIYSQTSFGQDKDTTKKGGKFFLDLTAQYHESFGGDYKVPVPPFSYTTPDPVSMQKAGTFNYLVSAAIGYPINKNIKITLGISYTKQGQNYSDYSGTEQDTGTGFTAVNYVFSRKVELTYLKIPLQFYYNTNENKAYSLSCYVGFYYSYLLQYMDAFNIDGSTSKGHIVWSDTATGNTYHEYYHASMPWYYGNTNATYSFKSKPYKAYDFGQTLGIGVRKKLSPNVSFLIMLNYQYGFTDIKNNDSEYITNNSTRKFWGYFGSLDPNQFTTYYNSLFGISAGFRVKL